VVIESPYPRDGLILAWSNPDGVFVIDRWRDCAHCSKVSQNIRDGLEVSTTDTHIGLKVQTFGPFMESKARQRTASAASRSRLSLHHPQVLVAPPEVRLEDGDR
jgi:hypothetical protein